MVDLRLVPKGKWRKRNQLPSATRATQHRECEVLRTVGEEPSSSLLTKLCLLSLKHTQLSQPRADGFLRAPFWGGVA